jgi:dienelactone hydrolase
MVLASTTALAEVKSKTIEYTYEGQKFIGVLYYDDAVKGKRPGVLVVHEWWGLNQHARDRAQELAKLGYVAFACDMYGDGKTTEHPMDANKMASDVRKNADNWRGRAQAALKVLQDAEQCDSSKLAAMGFCFGGTTALQLASTGADLKAVVTFHAALPPFTEDAAKKIKAKVLVCHGKDDFFIKPEAITGFKKALADAKVSLDFQEYEGAVHSFTVSDADKHNIKGMAYNKAADEKSWASMKALFAEVLK